MLSPPFTNSSGIETLQSAYEDIPPDFDNFDGTKFRTEDQLSKFLVLHLMTPKLDGIHQHLWRAGYPRPVRPLYMHNVMHREIVITEDPEEHLLYDSSVIYIKRLPNYILSYDFWKENLCGDDALYQSAAGLLLSYTWLIRYKSDFYLARKHHLISEGFDWKQWKLFANDFLDNYEGQRRVKISKRFSYGDLRLATLSHIKGFNPAGAVQDRMNNLLRSPWWYEPFAKRNLARLFAVFVFFQLILQAMQLALETEKLRTSAVFNRFCYGFAIVSIALVIFGALVQCMGWVHPALNDLFQKWKMKRNMDKEMEQSKA